MAKPQEKRAFMASISPIREREEAEDIDEYEDTILTSGCGCSQIFCFQWQQSKGGETKYLLQQKDEDKEMWFVKKLKRIKEVSEVLAGPKWKNFIRKIGKCFDKKKTRTQFRYDLHSYALNFDDGGNDGEAAEEEENKLLFKSKFAPTVSSEERRAEL